MFIGPNNQSLILKRVFRWVGLITSRSWRYVPIQVRADLHIRGIREWDGDNAIRVCFNLPGLNRRKILQQLYGYCDPAKTELAICFPESAVSWGTPKYELCYRCHRKDSKFKYRDLDKWRPSLDYLHKLPFHSSRWGIKIGIAFLFVSIPRSSRLRNQRVLLRSLISRREWKLVAISLLHRFLIHIELNKLRCKSCKSWHS